MQSRIDSIKDKLEDISQGHILQFWDELEESQREILLRDIETLDFDNIPKWVETYIKNNKPLEVPSNFEPAPYFPANADDTNKALYAKAKSIGEDFIRANKLGAFIVAGGQGTRLGYDGPKGNFPISPIKEKSLFQIFAETILAAQKKYNATIPWYIMTSPLNNAPTVASFEKNNYFGLDPQNVFIFNQAAMPNFDMDGKIFMSRKYEIAKSPDGHGGSLKALYRSGAVENMRKRGIEQLSYFQVDNPLTNIVDPLFLGLHILQNAQMSSKALKKAYPTEKVGNFALVDGKVRVIEYSDLSDEQVQQKKPDGSLVFELGSIAIHIIDREFIEEINSDGFALPLHRAIKKIPHIDSSGNSVNPDEPNGIKLETFVFDALPLAKSSIILETIRKEEFAPVKNATGLDSPEITKAMMSERGAKWLENAGIKVPRKSDGSLNCTIEIAPSFALSPEDVVAKAESIPTINPKERLYLS